MILQVLLPPSIHDDILQPSISLSQYANEACGWYDHTSQLSVASVPTTPFVVLSSAFRFESSANNNNNVAMKTTPYPVYYITLQYYQNQTFNFTAIALGRSKSAANYTIPE